MYIMYVNYVYIIIVMYVYYVYIMIVMYVNSVYMMIVSSVMILKPSFVTHCTCLNKLY